MRLMDIPLAPVLLNSMLLHHLLELFPQLAPGYIHAFVVCEELGPICIPLTSTTCNLAPPAVEYPMADAVKGNREVVDDIIWFACFPKYFGKLVPEFLREEVMAENIVEPLQGFTRQ